MMDGAEINTAGAEVLDTGDGEQTQARDYEAEARGHGWTPKDDFRGDPAKWVDAETFAKRADEVMPFLKKQNVALKREMDDLKKQFRQATAHFSKAEERGYQRAMTDLQAKHVAAVEVGDVKAATAIVEEMKGLNAEVRAKPEEPDEKPAFDPADARKELDTWVKANDWYGFDEPKTKFADLQANMMGPATEWPDGNQAWLDELGKRVARKFAEPKVNPVNTGGNRGGAQGGGKTFADLPPAAKAACDKWVKSGLIKSREDYVKSYDFGA